MLKFLSLLVLLTGAFGQYNFRKPFLITQGVRGPERLSCNFENDLCGLDNQFNMPVKFELKRNRYDSLYGKSSAALINITTVNGRGAGARLITPYMDVDPTLGYQGKIFINV